jgi:methyl-accepting chemotaxis protein
MLTLDASSQEINGIVSVITRVAHQIKLLSLNAAIEAANAGEYGRGFDVIATEVRQLADESRVAALSVTRLVADIQAAAAGRRAGRRQRGTPGIHRDRRRHCERSAEPRGSGRRLRRVRHRHRDGQPGHS